LKILDSEKVFVFLGTLFPFCGLDRVLADFVKKDGKFLQIKLLILGDGYLLKQLQETVRSYQIDSQVIFLGRVEYEQLGDYLNLADVAAMPFNSEKVSELALPWKVVQYIAAGLPVVATPLKGLLSAFPPGEGVRYAKPGDNFVEEMYDLACNKEKSDELVTRGLQRIRSRFLWDTNIVEFERLIQDVSLSPNKRKR